MRGLLLVLTTGFGLGYSPLAPGTTGTLPGLPLALAIALLPPHLRIWACVVLALLAIPLCDWGENYFDRKDDRHIVADEWLTFPICLLGLPWLQYPWLLAIAFVVSRGFDILKPPPARQAQQLNGGLGIVADDVMSGLYALAVNHLIWVLILRTGLLPAG